MPACPGKSHSPHSPAMGTHTLPQPLFPSSASKKLPFSEKQAEVWETEGEAEESGADGPNPRGAPSSRPKVPPRGRDQLPPRFPPHLGCSHVASSVAGSAARQTHPAEALTQAAQGRSERLLQLRTERAGGPDRTAS